MRHIAWQGASDGKVGLLVVLLVTLACNMPLTTVVITRQQ